MPDQPSGTGFCQVMQTGGEDGKAFDFMNWARAKLTFTIYVRAPCWRARSQALLLRIKAADPVCITARLRLALRQSHDGDLSGTGCAVEARLILSV